MQGIAILGLMALGYLAVENWTFGFERIVDLRLKTVNSASRELSRDEAYLAALLKRRKHIATTNGEKREELRRGVAQRDASIGELTAQLSREGEVHQENLERIREACRIIKESCMVPRSQAEDSRYRDQVTRLNAELAAQRVDRKQLVSQIDELVSKDAREVADLDRRISTTTLAYKARGSIGVDWKSTAIPGRLAVPFQLVALPGEPSDARPGNMSPRRPATSRRSSDIVAFADFVSPSLRLKARVWIPEGDNQ